MKTYKSTITKYNLVKESSDIKKVKINSSNVTNEYLHQLWDKDIDIQESVYALFINSANNTIGYKLISKGGINSAIIDIRIILKYAIESLSTKIVIAHNHPSGNILPSDMDNNITKKIKSGLKMLDITLLDHIILSGNDKNKYYSYADNGAL